MGEVGDVALDEPDKRDTGELDDSVDDHKLDGVADEMLFDSSDSCSYSLK